MKNKITKIVISWLMVIATMVIIYNFSDETAKESAETSSGIIKEVLEVVMPKEEITDEVVKKFQIPVRKLAHFTIFALLGFTLANAFKGSFQFKSIYNYLLSFASVVIYASSDEFHQSLVANRGPSIKDVLIDSCGGFAGILVFILMIYIINKFKMKKQF